jgi:hypothetical protein
MHGRMTREVAERLDFDLNVVSVTAHNLFPPSALHDATLSFLARRKPGITVVACEWSKYAADNPGRIRALVDEILLHSRQVVLLTQPPVLPRRDCRQLLRDEGPTPLVEPEGKRRERETTNRFVRELASERVRVVETEDLFLREDGTVRFDLGRGKVLYHDSTHLSGLGSRRIMPRLEAVLSELTGSAAAPP